MRNCLKDSQAEKGGCALETETSRGVKTEDQGLGHCVWVGVVGTAWKHSWEMEGNEQKSGHKWFEFQATELRPDPVVLSTF